MLVYWSPGVDPGFVQGTGADQGERVVWVGIWEFGESEVGLREKPEAVYFHTKEGPKVGCEPIP